MSESSLHHQLTGEGRFCALQESSGQAWLWREQAQPGDASAPPLHVQRFHHPRELPPSLWGDFPANASWNLAGAARVGQGAFPAEGPAPAPRAPRVSDRAAWNTLCQAADTAIAGGIVRKLVPARRISYALTPGEHAAILARLPGRLFSAPPDNTFRFLLKSRASVFFGATPELLFRREGGLIHVPAIAGTRALTSGASESALREELSSSEKEQAEHAWVVSGIREALLGLGLAPQVPAAPEVLRVPRLLHLHTPIAAPDDSRVSGAALVSALHPTPAIAGYPKAPALGFLREHEGWDRGLFSAPLRFRLPERELCLVAIRSGLLTPTHLYLFAGAGYVAGSTAEREWEETERKLQVMQTLLFGENFDGNS